MKLYLSTGLYSRGILTQTGKFGSGAERLETPGRGEVIKDRISQLMNGMPCRNPAHEVAGQGEPYKMAISLTVEGPRHLWRGPSR